MVWGMSYTRNYVHVARQLGPPNLQALERPVQSRALASRVAFTRYTSVVLFVGKGTFLFNQSFVILATLP